LDGRRFQLLPTLGDRKSAFNEYLQARKKEEAEEERRRVREARDAFVATLEARAAVEAGGYRNARELFEKEAWWQVRAPLSLARCPP
jgi:pre-mRNA-processing factor 40